ncbi:YycC-like protein [Salsuginibacillus halophilus]|uniref:YycC-like protein n=1 Tax=Salsuginibacillus halophilus TaxID=517424 RepID=A0A2P8HIB1_9BACI|nr:YycC family protein [Salsuginibacillus halophilus]PSL45964.1 YycC-like protein [Salsuginibacillus halophilus]
MRPNQFSAETAQMIAEKLNMPIEHVMHTPPHILTAKLSELEEKESPDEEDEKA